MKLKRLVAFSDEVGNALDKYKSKLVVEKYDTTEELKARLDEDAEIGDETLLVAGSQEAIAFGVRYGLAVMGYQKSQGNGAWLSGVDMVVEEFEEVDYNFLEKVYQRWHNIPWTIAVTPRCIIREISLTDMDALFELYSDKALLEFSEELFSYEEETKYQEAYINNMYRFFGYGMWLVFSKETGELIGRAGLEHREYHGETELELGYMIASKYQGQGIATEVCQAILRIAKNMTDFPRINCLIDECNYPSIALAKKLGFTYLEELNCEEKKMHRYFLSLFDN